MPATKDIETALRAFGWSPAAIQPFVHIRIWTHPEFLIEIKVPRKPFVTARVAHLIMRRVRRPAGR